MVVMSVSVVATVAASSVVAIVVAANDIVVTRSGVAKEITNVNGHIILWSNFHILVML